MNIMSCKHCGVLLNKDVLNFPFDIYDEGGSVNDARASWDGEDFVPKVKCPCCKEEILETDQ